MAKAIFFGLPLHGHTNPSLPLVRELVARGDQIVYASTDPFAASIRQTGARYCAYRSAALGELTHLPERLEEFSWLQMRITAEILASELESFRAERPDYVIVDSVAPWGHWIGQALAVPIVTSVTTFAVNRHVLAFAAKHAARPRSLGLVVSKIRHMAKAAALARRTRRRYGVTGTGVLGLVFGRSDLNIVYTSRYLQPCADSFDDRYQFIGPSIAARADAPAPVLDCTPAGDLVYVSLGTLFNADPAFYRQCFEAFRGQDVRVVMSIGDTIAADSLGPPPHNVVVQPRVAQLDVLRQTAVFVTHGGMNSVAESLYYGVPMVVVPQMSEQRLVGRQVEAIGAGLCLAAKQATAARLRESVQRIRADARFRQQAAVARQSFDAAGGVVRGVDAIVAFTAPHVSRAASGGA
jgi:MGT family glycosyltransferase